MRSAARPAHPRRHRGEARTRRRAWDASRSRAARATRARRAGSARTRSPTRASRPTAAHGASGSRRPEVPRAGGGRKRRAGSPRAPSSGPGSPVRDPIATWTNERAASRFFPSPETRRAPRRSPLPHRPPAPRRPPPRARSADASVPPDRPPPTSPHRRDGLHDRRFPRLRPRLRAQRAHVSRLARERARRRAQGAPPLRRHRRPPRRRPRGATRTPNPREPRHRAPSPPPREPAVGGERGGERPERPARRGACCYGSRSVLSERSRRRSIDSHPSPSLSPPLPPSPA